MPSRRQQKKGDPKTALSNALFTYYAFNFLLKSNTLGVAMKMEL